MHVSGILGRRCKSRSSSGLLFEDATGQPTGGNGKVWTPQNNAIYAIKSRSRSIISLLHASSVGKYGGTSWLRSEPMHHRSEGTPSSHAWWNTWRRRWNSDKQRGADSLFTLVAWELWKQRNTRCFRHTTSIVPQVLAVIKHVGSLWIDSGACKLGCLVSE